IFCTDPVNAAVTPGSPADEPQRSMFAGSLRLATFARKQLPAPTPFASARSARPLPVTVFRVTRLSRARHGGPGSGAAWGRNMIRLAGGKTRSEEHTPELQSRGHLVCPLLL